MARRTATEDVRRQIEAERAKLADAVDDFRAAANVRAIVRSKLPVLAVAGGIGATLRLLTRRVRQGRTKAKAGRFSVVDRD